MCRAPVRVFVFSRPMPHARCGGFIALSLSSPLCTHAHTHFRSSPSTHEGGTSFVFSAHGAKLCAHQHSGRCIKESKLPHTHTSHLTCLRSPVNSPSTGSFAGTALDERRCRDEPKVARSVRADAFAARRSHQEAGCSQGGMWRSAMWGSPSESARFP